MNQKPFANGLCLVCFFVAPPRLLEASGKEPLPAVGSSQDWEAAPVRTRETHLLCQRNSHQRRG